MKEPDELKPGKEYFVVWNRSRFFLFVISISVAELMGCHHTDKKRLEEKDCRQPKVLIIQISRQDKGCQEANVFIPICGNCFAYSWSKTCWENWKTSPSFGNLNRIFSSNTMFSFVYHLCRSFSGKNLIWHISHPQSFYQTWSILKQCIDPENQRDHLMIQK